MPAVYCASCNVRQPLVVKPRCASCGKLLTEKPRYEKPTDQDIAAYQNWLFQQEMAQSGVTPVLH